MSPRPPPSVTAKAPVASFRSSASFLVHTVKVPLMFGPNITGTEQSDENPPIETCTGAFYKAGSYSNTGAGSVVGSGILGFDASRASSLFGKSTVVQPDSLRALPCIKF